MIKILGADALRNACNDDLLELQKIAEASNDQALIGQKRAEEALKLGLGIKADGFNVFVSGDDGTGKLTAVKLFLEKKVKTEPVPGDWCYVNDFQDAYQPKRLFLPVGHANMLKKNMKALIHETVQSLMKVFESEEYAKRRQEISDKHQQQQIALSAIVDQKAAKESLVIKQTPWEIYTVAVQNGEPITDEAFEALPEDEKKKIADIQTGFADEVASMLKEQRRLEKEAVAAFEKLETEVASFAINTLIDEIKTKYATFPEVVAYLQSVRDDILSNLGAFLISHKESFAGGNNKANNYLSRYEVNALVDNSGQTGAPIIIETNPTYNNLIGRVEKESVMGSLVTDFTMIRKGSLHQANGGYLIIRAAELFKNYFSWEALKRAIRNKEILIEEAMDQLGYLTTKSLKPQAIPLQVKVILVGSPYYYHVLYAIDNEFKNLFKVKVDFNAEMERNPENTASYIRFLNTLGIKEPIGKPDAEAMKKIIEYGSRLAEDQGKLSTRFGRIADLLREANHYALDEQSAVISGRHIQMAVEKKAYRSNLIQEKINEMVQEKQILIDIKGSKTGQVNALSVIDMGDLMFGKPNRITCSINLGKAGIVAIEREAELSGPIHTKGVLILTGYLAEKFFQDKPVSLSARLVFEQSYSEVEGDSASSTELYALLSGLAKLPIKQGIAVTGSVNQKGEVQAIGGINEKIEGYFELCKLIGLNGEQGVMIPSSNARQLMLKEDILEAVRQHQFKIWTVETIDDGIEILTGIRAGTIEEEGTVNGMVNKVLKGFSERMKSFADGGEDESARQNGQVHWVSDIASQ